MARVGLLLLPLVVFFQPAHAEYHEVYGKTEGVTVGYRVEPLNTIDSASITVTFHDDTMASRNNVGALLRATLACSSLDSTRTTFRPLAITGWPPKVVEPEKARRGALNH
jgi:hypothetical protein